MLEQPPVVGVRGVAGDGGQGCRSRSCSRANSSASSSVAIDLRRESPGPVKQQITARAPWVPVWSSSRVPLCIVNTVQLLADRYKYVFICEYGD